jgi:hypothetical protein
MNTNWQRLGLFALVSAAGLVGAGCDGKGSGGGSRAPEKQVAPSGPSIKIISRKLNVPLLDENTMDVVARNVGAAGDVTFVCSTRDRKKRWRLTTYFNAGEERAVSIKLSDMDSDDEIRVETFP